MNFLFFKIIFENKKEVIQPQVPLRLPCDDLTPLTKLRFVLILAELDLTQTPLEWFDGRCVQGAGTNSPEDGDFRLLGIPSS